MIVRTPALLTTTSLGRSRVLASMTVLLAACGSAVKLDETPVESRTGSAVGGAGAAGAGAAAAGAGQGANASGAGAGQQVTTVDTAASTTKDVAKLPPGVGRIVYFDFDSFALRADARTVVEAHAQLLMTNRGQKLVVEGHTDERGGREYNLALGQKRADAVVRALVLLGAQPDQLEAVSFGEERPAAPGSDENAWALSRRAELKEKP